ncbi:MAG TPA: 3-isopropylmalate dehydrogenase [Methylomirabilota bacterium]|nr:3-isopropylmalate dehydrogenase [Methylomirabilota bacterium]
MATYKIAVLGGDGIGPEVISEAVKVLKVVAKKAGVGFEFENGLVGGAAIDGTGSPLPDSTLKLCQKSHAVLFGAVGGPKWDNAPNDKRPERGLLGLRKALDVYANLRPAKCFPMLVDASPLKRSVVEGTDILVVRELTGGLYFGEPKKIEPTATGMRAVDTMSYTTEEIERVAHVAFQVARQRQKRLTSVDKQNVLVTSQLWRQVITEVWKGYPDVALQHLLVDNAAMQLVTRPRDFDVIVTENTFGDILSDEAAVLTGSMGMLPSASLGGATALYEPVHGTAPDIAGEGIANPIAAILSGAMMLRHSFRMPDAAERLEHAVVRVLEKGYRTKDLYREGTTLVGTSQMGDLIARELDVLFQQ